MRSKIMGHHIDSAVAGVLGGVGGVVCGTGAAGLGVVAFADSGAPPVVTLGFIGAASIASGLAGTVGTMRLCIDDHKNFRPATAAFAAATMVIGTGLMVNQLIQTHQDTLPAPAPVARNACEHVAPAVPGDHQVILTFPGTELPDCFINAR